MARRHIPLIHNVTETPGRRHAKGLRDSLINPLLAGYQTLATTWKDRKKNAFDTVSLGADDLGRDRLRLTPANGTASRRGELERESPSRIKI